MLPGMNSRQMKQMMKRMGVAQTGLEATQVIIKTADKMLVFNNPEVSKVNMMGQETFQVVGVPEEQSLDTTPDINEEDVQTVVDQTGVSVDEAKTAIENANGDLAKAILSLKQDEESSE